MARTPAIQRMITEGGRSGLASRAVALASRRSSSPRVSPMAPSVPILKKARRFMGKFNPGDSPASPLVRRSMVTPILPRTRRHAGILLDEMHLLNRNEALHRKRTLCRSSGLPVGDEGNQRVRQSGREQSENAMPQEQVVIDLREPVIILDAVTAVIYTRPSLTIVVQTELVQSEAQGRTAEAGLQGRSRIGDCIVFSASCSPIGST